MIHLQLVSSAGNEFEGDVYEVLVPTSGGVIGIFEDHMPIITAANAGLLSIRKRSSDSDADMELFAINGGIVEVDGKSVRFVADDITSSDEVNEKEAAAALARAKDLIAGAKSATALHEAHRLLNHSTASLHIAGIKKRHHR